MKPFKLSALMIAIALLAGCGKSTPDVVVPEEITPERQQQIANQNATVEAEEKANMRRK